MNWRSVWITAGLGALVVGYGILTDRDAAQLNVRPPPLQPGYYLEDAVITETQADGTPKIRFAAREIRQNPADDSIMLKDVRADYLAASDTPWMLTANLGHVPAQSQIIHFSGDVVLKEESTSRSAMLRTDALTVDIERNSAQTCAGIAAELEVARMEAACLEADLAAGRIRLQSGKATANGG